MAAHLRASSSSSRSDVEKTSMLLFLHMLEPLALALSTLDMFLPSIDLTQTTTELLVMPNFEHALALDSSCHK